MFAAALIVASLAGCTWTSGSTGQSTATVVVGGSGQQRAVMEHILHELGASSIERVWIGNPPHRGRAGVLDGPHWLAFRIRAHTGLSDTRDLPGRAQAMIAADLFARSSAAAGLPAVSGASTCRTQTGAACTQRRGTRRLTEAGCWAGRFRADRSVPRSRTKRSRAAWVLARSG